MASVAPTQSQIQTAVRSFLTSILPDGFEVVQAQDNRVGEPRSPNFVVMTSIMKERLATNTNVYADVAFTGMIVGTVLTVSFVEFGLIKANTQLFATGISSSQTMILTQTSGTVGGVGTYTVSVAQTVGPVLMASGQVTITQTTKTTIQLDVHSPDATTSSDAAAIISTMFRSETATDFFAATGYAVYPLYADDPRQSAYINSEQQYETRWTIDAVVQANESIPWPQQFAQNLTATPVLSDNLKT